MPVVTAFAPDLILLSAGFDAHARDPLGGMRVSTGGYDAMTDHVHRLAARCCRGRLVAVTEGGYDLTALEACLDSTLARLSAGPPAPSAVITRGHEPGGPGDSRGAAGPRPVLARAALTFPLE